MTIRNILLPQRKLISWFGAAIMAVTFLAGWGYGHRRATDEIPQLAATNAKIDKLDKAVFTDPTCMSALVAEAKIIKESKSSLEGN